MGIPDTLATRLIELTKQQNLSGHMLMLGRQVFHGTRRGASAKMFAQAIKDHLPGMTEDDLRNPNDQYAETFFRKLGFSAVDSLDMSDFENASIIRDLGKPIEKDLHETFDVIYDGGTCEHIFDLPTAYRNVDKMLKPGGVFVAHSPGNNWINHGFYQICPEIVFGFWARAMGYEIITCELQPLRPHAAEGVVRMSNPLVTGRRPRLDAAPPGGLPLLLNFAVRKPMESRARSETVSQSDYAVRWNEAAEAED
ncbi:class I SAM-dependent methyltransferase [Yoonia sp. 2307UL14-13]|uniref:class I SAM-dependent methyltransferase n=1 Tax=Yoonia sp. 2307UL14-13 TaxID=3126506 RepID=UPI0030AA0DBF